MKNLSRASRQNRKGFVLLSLLSLFLLLLPSNKPLNAIQIDINTAPLEDLVKIIHIGEKRALELISLRPFSSLDDLIKIKGIAEARVQDIKKQGLAWIVVSQIEKIEPAEVEPAGVGSLKIYPIGIVINEILPSPEGPDAENEWIEIFNQNNFIVSLADWKIKDSEGSVHTFIFSKTAQILAKEFLILSRKTTKITLNNDGDEISIIQPDGKIIDRVDFVKAPLSQSYNLTETGWLWSTTLTPGAINIIPIIKESELPEQVKEISFQKNIEENLSKKELAAINDLIEKPFNFLNVLFPALIFAFASGIIILIIDFKNKLE